MDSQETTEERSVTVDAVLDRMATTFEKKLEQHDESTARKLDAWVDGLEKERSHTPPIQRVTRDPETGGDVVDVQRFRTLGDGRDMLYRSLEAKRCVNRSEEERKEFRAARNPKMDELTAEWARAVWNGDGGRRAQITQEMNDLYYRTLVTSPVDPNSGLGSGTGGALVPLPLAGQIVIERDLMAVMRNLVRIYPMSAQTERVPVLPTVPAATRGENGSFTDNTPVSDSVLLSATDLGVEFSAGRNFLEDSAFDIARALTEVAGQSIGAGEDIQICTSTGAGNDITEGLDGATIIDVPETTPNNIVFGDIVNLHYALPKQYRNNSAYFCNGGFLAVLSNLVDGNGRPIFIDQFNAPRPLGNNETAAVGILYGKPVYEVPVADQTIYHGDPTWYALGDRMSIRVDVDRAVSTGQRTWVIDQRFDGRVIPTGVTDSNFAWRKMIISP